MKRTLLTIFLCLFLCQHLSANSFNSQDTTKTGLLDSFDIDRFPFIIIPLIYFSPENGFQLGAGGLYDFYIDREDTLLRESYIRPYFLYAFGDKEIKLDLDFELWLEQNKYALKGEGMLYKETEQFWGIGNNTTNAMEENFRMNTVGGQFSFYYLINREENIYIGPRINFRKYDIVEYEEGGLLIGNQGIEGTKGGILTGGGFLINYDSRDATFYPTKGSYIEANSFHYTKTLGGDFSYNSYVFDARKYVGAWGRSVFAAQFYTQLTFGYPPFQDLSLLGGGKRLRGLNEGRFRDNHMISTQLEYRWPLFWRIGVAAFGGVGRVAEDIKDFTDFSGTGGWKPAGGAGLRFAIDQEDWITFRFDVAYSQVQGLGFYVSFKEAF